MPRIERFMMQSVVYVLNAAAPDGGPVDPDDLDDVVPNEKSGGTGFLIIVPWNGISGGLGYVVTNSHAISKTEPSFVRAAVNDGADRKDFRIEADEWIYHAAGDDVAIAYLHHAHAYDFILYGMPVSMLHKGDDDLEIRPGDEAFFIGRQLSLDGGKRVTPTVRFGAVSMTDVEPIYQGEDRPRYQKSLVIEARTFGGYSGSPVYVVPSEPITAPIKVESTMRMIGEEPFDPSVANRDAIVRKRPRNAPLILAGICWGHMGPNGATLPGLKDLTRGERQMIVNSGMMLVVPARTILEVLMSEKASKRRAEVAKVSDEAEERAGIMDSVQSGDDADGDRVSLAGVDPEDALRALLKTPPTRAN